METLFYPRVKQLLESSQILPKHGFDPACAVETWGKGADFNDLLQVKKPSWQVAATDGESLGYQGVEIHWESCRPAHWVLHGELYPRQSKAAKAAVLEVSDLLDLKGELTTMIRQQGKAEGWETQLGAHLMRAREDPRHPSSLIIYTFELGLPPNHAPDQFAERVLRIIDKATPTIDAIVIDR